MSKANFLALSSALHLLFLLMIGTCINVARNESKLGSANSRIVQSYIFHDKIDQTQTKAKPTKPHALKKTSPEKPKKIIAHTTNTEQKHIATLGEESHKLLALLHAAIQKQQQYPKAALEMEREGRVTVTFMLYPDGKISHLNISQSSGTASLDTAGLAAVQNAAPFVDAQGFITQPGEYKIDVVFELT